MCVCVFFFLPSLSLKLSHWVIDEGFYLYIRIWFSIRKWFVLAKKISAQKTHHGSQNLRAWDHTLYSFDLMLIYFLFLWLQHMDLAIARFHTSLPSCLNLYNLILIILNQSIIDPMQVLGVFNTVFNFTMLDLTIWNFCIFFDCFFNFLN